MLQRCSLGIVLCLARFVGCRKSCWIVFFNRVMLIILCILFPLGSRVWRLPVYNFTAWRAGCVLTRTWGTHYLPWMLSCWKVSVFSTLVLNCQCIPLFYECASLQRDVKIFLLDLIVLMGDTRAFCVFHYWGLTHRHQEEEVVRSVKSCRRFEILNHCTEFCTSAPAGLHAVL